MTVLVLGRSGQLARALVAVNEEAFGLALQTSGRAAIDLLVPGAATQAIQTIRPRLIVNTAAFTAVDRAEAEPELAQLLNADAAGEIAAAAHQVGAPLIHISTDYVFAGDTDRALGEDDPVGPLQVYGRTKLAGERQLRARHPNHLILRTSWLFGATGGNFVATMLGLAARSDEVRVVADQRGCPTDVRDLARVILTLANRRLESNAAGWGATIHAAGTEACSWADLAAAVFACSQAQGGPSAVVRPIATADYPTAARRPMCSVLDCSALQHIHGLAIPSYRARLDETVAALLRG